MSYDTYLHLQFAYLCPKSRIQMERFVILVIKEDKHTGDPDSFVEYALRKE